MFDFEFRSILWIPFTGASIVRLPEQGLLVPFQLLRKKVGF
jgi:hypothetical protein